VDLIFISTTVDEIEYLNPKEVMMKGIFLTESDNQFKRKQLRNRLKSWISLLRSTSNVGDMVEKCESQSELYQKLLPYQHQTSAWTIP
jgi:hypothetical protein